MPAVTVEVSELDEYGGPEILSQATPHLRFSLQRYWMQATLQVSTSWVYFMTELYSSLKNCALEAELAEVGNFFTHDVFELILPDNYHLISGQVVPVVLITVEKLDGDGDFVKWKARVIALGTWSTFKIG